MKTYVSLLALAFLALAAPAASAGGLPVDTKDVCVQYMYIADYHWYYVCADPKDASCVVYEKQVHGVTETRTCYGVPDTVAVRDLCSPEIGDLDHRYAICASANARCPVYVAHQNGGRTCLV
jgi:hypothetical protein